MSAAVHRPGSRPLLAETVDRETGVIRAAGRLTPAGVDLLLGTAEGLWRQGHGSVVLDMVDVRADDAVLAALYRERAELARLGRDLVVVGPARTA